MLDFKTGTGGVIEAEFLVQALQMRAGIWNPQTMGALRELTAKGLLSQEEAALLKRKLPISAPDRISSSAMGKQKRLHPSRR